MREKQRVIPPGEAAIDAIEHYLSSARGALLKNAGGPDASPAWPLIEGSLLVRVFVVADREMVA